MKRKKKARKLTSRDLKKALERHVKNIAKERDAMRDLLHKYSDIVRDCDEAVECLGDAIVTLSQRV